MPLPAPEGITHLQFRQFASCPICNLHLRTFVTRYAELQAVGVHEIVVFHSTVEQMRPHQGALPFSAIADPERILYAEFGVGRSLLAVLHPRAWVAPLQPEASRVRQRERRARRIRGSAGDNDELGLPADFLIGPDAVVRHAHYGRHASDHWSLEQVLALSQP